MIIHVSSLKSEHLCAAYFAFQSTANVLFVRESNFLLILAFLLVELVKSYHQVYGIVFIPSCASSDIVCFGHYRDVQASSVLLDDKFEVRLGSLSDVCAQEGDIHQSRITRLLRLPQ